MEQKDRLKLFLFQIAFFAVIMGLSLGAGYRGLYGQSELSRALNELLASQELGAWEFIIIFLVVTLILFFFLKILKGNTFFEFVFYLAMAWGIFLILAQFIPIILAGYLTAFLIILNAIFYKVWLHNIIIILGIAGISLNFGVRISLEAALIILLFLVIYDYIAVYKTKHMIKMFYRLKERGIVLSLVVPHKAKNFTYSMQNASPGGDFMFIGTGDIAFPTIFAITVLKDNLTGSLFIAVGALLGIVFTQYIFIKQKEKKPLPALPSIILFTVLGYLVYLTKGFL